MSPHDSIVLSNRAQTYLNMGRPEEAEKDCTLSLQIDGSNLKSMYRRALARKELGDVTNALGDLERLLLRERKPEVLQLRNELSEKKRRLDKASMLERKTMETFDAKVALVKTSSTWQGEDVVKGIHMDEVEEDAGEDWVEAQAVEAEG